MANIKLTEFRQIKFKHIYMASACLKEIKKITSGSSIQNDFQNWLLDRLREIDDDKISYVDINSKRFERIDEFYNITYRHSEKNIRILFSRETNGKIYILLCAFDEKNTDSDYKKAKRLARQRRKDRRE